MVRKVVMTGMLMFVSKGSLPPSQTQTFFVER
eukprot:COSAG03_NODE_20350_length_320_cov_1.515837_1_plen_31_part_10